MTDVVVIGAGVMGLCTALQLARRAELSITVLDKGLGPGEGSSGASSAICRHLYSHDEMVALARDGIEAYRNWAAFLESDDEPLAVFQAVGALWLGHPGHLWQADTCERLARFGVASRVIDDTELRQRFPAINPCVKAPDFATGEDHDCAGGATHLLETDAGFMDPVSVLQDLVAALARRGVKVRFRTRVTRIECSGGRVKAAVCADGERIDAAWIVNASGPWCNALLGELQLAQQWPLQPTRIQMVHLERPAAVVGDIPVCVDMLSGIYFRPQNRGQQLILGSTLEEDEQEVVSDPDHFDTLSDEDFRLLKLHALHHRLPALPYAGQLRGYAGLYTVNQADMHPVVGASPVDGFVVVNGFSGHGFKLAPAIGSLLAQHITGTRMNGDTDVPIDFLAWGRDPLPLETKNVLA